MLSVGTVDHRGLQQDPTSENMFAVADTIITIFNSEQLL